ncbi:hypothetical protein ACQP2Y_21230 [Actinoplanes sp. CA-051413]|uniref:hypothetical protein n=1 Tax=Actinoplanes sp. CA-051413 TaxID=3239899 RepID=UPI003D9683A2
MSDLKEGVWIRLPHAPAHAPLAKWRRLSADPAPVGWPRWMVALAFDGGYAVPYHRDALTDFETSTVQPEGA